MSLKEFLFFLYDAVTYFVSSLNELKKSVRFHREEQSRMLLFTGELIAKLQ